MCGKAAVSSIDSFLLPKATGVCGGNLRSRHDSKPGLQGIRRLAAPMVRLAARDLQDCRNDGDYCRSWVIGGNGW
jgi:hypothetical protein